MEVQQLAAERRNEAFDRMEANILEAELRQKSELRRPEVETGSGTGASEEEEARDEEDEKDSDEGTMMSGEEIYGPGEDAEREDDVSDVEKDIDHDAV